MKALLEIYLRTAGVALARQHFLTTHEYMNAKLVLLITLSSLKKVRYTW